MSGTASVCAFYAAIAIVILVMWRTSSWIGADGLIAAYRQRHPNLITFHLPGTSLLLLVCAFAGKELALNAYRHAVAERYRFYSYGDCMLIV